MTTRPLLAIEGKGTGYKTCRPMGALEPLGPASCRGQGYVRRYPRRPSELSHPRSVLDRGYRAENGRNASTFPPVRLAQALLTYYIVEGPFKELHSLETVQRRWL